MAAFLVNKNQNVKEMNVEDVWKFNPYNSTLTSDISKAVENMDITDAYSDQCVNDSVTETLPRLTEVASNIKQTIIRYYSNEIEKLQTTINEYEKKLNESPTFGLYETMKIHYYLICWSASD